MTYAILLLLLAQADRPVRAVPDPGVITTRQTITPAGVPTIFQGRVYGVAFGADSAELWVLHANHVYRLDWRQNKVLSRVVHGGGMPGLQGLAFRNGATYFGMRQGSGAGEVRLAKLTANDLSPSLITGSLGEHLAGALAVGETKALVPLIFNNALAVVDVATRKTLGKVQTGIAPFAAVMNRAGTVAYVSNWGGRQPNPKDLSAPTGYAANADRVVVDARGVGASGTITRIDLQTLQITHTIPAGLHPMGLAWDEAEDRLYAANANEDSITVIDTAKNVALPSIQLQPFAVKAPGIAPNALALSPDGRRLYVACGGINAIAVVNLASRTVEGMIPTAWYPSALALSGDGRFLAVGTLLGAGSGWRDEPGKRYVHSHRGAVHVIEVPDSAQLASYTTAVAENTHLRLAGDKVVSAPVSRSTAPLAVPLRAGDPSLIEHVVYIIKENRTYDQLFGDLPKGNGDPSLVMFGQDITPNHRRLAQDYVLLDNFYATGGNSANGHQWLTQANEVTYTLWPGYAGRSYPFDGSDPLAHSKSGFIWDLALQRGKSVKVYGEYAGTLNNISARERRPLLDSWKRGEDHSSRWNITAPIASLNAILAKNYPSYSNGIPDVVRAQIFLKDVAAWDKSGKMPNLILLQLPSDHTYGSSPGASTPQAMVADNDLALGQIVEGLSKSKFWPKMAIFVVEDDAQNGVDHVDGHRTVALAVSPYTKGGRVDSTFYSNQSMLKTIELMLGLPTLSLFDLIANDMRAGFTEKPDPAPYTAITPRQDLFAVNPAPSALRGEARKAALASARFKWSEPDAAPSDRLNRILWHTVRGWDAPYPGTRRAAFAPFSLDVDDDDR
ncbi:MAG: hypothetical protein K2X03_06045 [Bryobacteraceae bacterium]|nr:hypothetical protein [Bryobacteraceae bacterium]